MTNETTVAKHQITLEDRPSILLKIAVAWICLSLFAGAFRIPAEFFEPGFITHSVIHMVYIILLFLGNVCFIFNLFYTLNTVQKIYVRNGFIWLIPFYLKEKKYRQSELIDIAETKPYPIGPEECLLSRTNANYLLTFTDGKKFRLSGDSHNIVNLLNMLRVGTHGKDNLDTSDQNECNSNDHENTEP